MIQCVIFDCDGTLVDSEFLCNLGLEIMLKKYSVISSAAKMMRKFRGCKLADIISSLEIDHNIKLGDNFIPSYRSLVDELFEERLTPHDGVHEMLSSLVSRKCVASSGPKEKINKALSVTGLSKYFADNVFSSYDVGSWKPDPGIFLHSAKTMGIAPEDCAVIEDSPLGIEAAKEANMRPIHFDPDDIYPKIKGVYKITHMSQVKSAIT